MNIETGRLVLRPHTLDDTDAMCAWHSDPKITRYLLHSGKDRDQVREIVGRRMRNTELPKENGHSINFIVATRTGEPVGEVHIEMLDAANRCAEIGYIFGDAHQGKGYATEAAEALLRLGFEDMSLHRIIAKCYAEHLASQKVMRRIGMRQEALFVDNEFLKGEWSSEAIWAILESDWKARISSRS